MKRSVLFILFSISFFTISAQELSMFSGFFDYQYYQDDKRIAKKEVVQLLETNQDARAHWKKSKTLSTLSYVALASEIGFFLNEVLDNKPYENTKNNTINDIGVYGSFAAALTLSIVSRAQKKKAILKYNQGLDKKKTTFQIKPAKKGVGIAVVF